MICVGARLRRGAPCIVRLQFPLRRGARRVVAIRRCLAPRCTPLLFPKAFHQLTKSAELNLRHASGPLSLAEKVEGFLEQIHVLLRGSELNPVLKRALSPRDVVCDVSRALERPLCFHDAPQLVRRALSLSIRLSASPIVRLRPVRGSITDRETPDRSRERGREHSGNRTARERGPNGLYQGRHRRLRIELGDEPRNLALGPEAGPLEHLRTLLSAEKGRDHEQARQVDLSPRQSVAEVRVPVNDPRCLRATVRGIFAHAQLVHAVRIERRARPLAVDAASLHFTEMGEKIGERHVGARSEPPHRDVKVIVGDRFERGVAHTTCIHP